MKIIFESEFVFFRLTNTERYELRVEMEDWRNQVAAAHYDSFSISSAGSDFKLHISGYSSVAGIKVKLFTN